MCWNAASWNFEGLSFQLQDLTDNFARTTDKFSKVLTEKLASFAMPQIFCEHLPSVNISKTTWGATAAFINLILKSTSLTKNWLLKPLQLEKQPFLNRCFDDSSKLLHM